MTYRPFLTPKAEEDFLRLDGALQNAAEACINRFCQSPVSLSFQSVTPPYPPNRQMYEVQHDLDGELHVLVFFFRYRDDEETLIVTDIGHRKLRRP